MNISVLLEKLANNTHHRVDLNNFLNDQSLEVRNAFENNDASWIKSFFTSNEISADRSIVVQIKK